MMKKVKEMAWRVLCSPYFPLCALALIVALLHIDMPTDFADDAWFYNILEGKDDMWEAWSAFLKYRYEVWSSRTLIEGALILLVRAPLAWKILDSVAIIYIIFELSRLLNPEKSYLKNAILVLVPIVFPRVLYEVGFVATSINYIIPFALSLLAVSILYRRALDRRVHIGEYFIALPMLIFACFSEMVSAMVLLLSLGAILWWALNKKGVPCVEIVVLAVSAVLIVYHLTCPGNDARAEQETLTWLPEHGALGLIEKVQLGISAMMRDLLLWENKLFGVFAMAIGVLISLKKRPIISIIFAWIPFAFSMLFSNLYSFFGKIPLIALLRDEMLSVCYDTDMGAHTILLDVVFVLVLFCVMYSLWQIIEDKRSYIFAFFVLFVGSATKIALGLSPTVWASAGRGATYLYIAISIVTGVVIYRLVTLARTELLSRLRSKK